MKTNETNENKLEIYAIFVRGKAKLFDFKNYHGKYLNHLNTIAQKGGTIEAKLPYSFQGLNEELKKIANSINKKFGLKLK